MWAEDMNLKETGACWQGFYDRTAPHVRSPLVISPFLFTQIVENLANTHSFPGNSQPIRMLSLSLDAMLPEQESK